MPTTDTGQGGVPFVPRDDGWVQIGHGPAAWMVRDWEQGLAGQDPRALLAARIRRSAHGGHRTGGDLSGPREVSVVGAGPLRSGIEAALEQGGVTVRDGAGVVVAVYPYLLPLGCARSGELAGRALLPVLPQAGRVVVGPWLDPGRRRDPCPHCLDLARVDRDPGWSRVALTIDDPMVQPPDPGRATVRLTAALVVQLLAAPREPDDVGLSYELRPRPPHLATRRWHRHPSCPWHEGC